MTLRLHYILVFVFGILGYSEKYQIASHHQSLEEEIPSPWTSTCPSALVPVQEGLHLPGLLAAAKTSQHPESTSLQGLPLHCIHLYSNGGDFTEHLMALFFLRDCQQQIGRFLPSMWRKEVQERGPCIHSECPCQLPPRYMAERTGLELDWMGSSTASSPQRICQSLEKTFEVCFSGSQEARPSRWQIKRQTEAWQGQEQVRPGSRQRQKRTSLAVSHHWSVIALYAIYTSCGAYTGTGPFETIGHCAEEIDRCIAGRCSSSSTRRQYSEYSNLDYSSYQCSQGTRTCQTKSATGTCCPLHPASELENLLGRSCSSLDRVCRAIWQRGCGPGSEHQGGAECLAAGQAGLECFTIEYGRERGERDSHLLRRRTCRHGHNDRHKLVIYDGHAQDAPHPGYYAGGRGRACDQKTPTDGDRRQRQSRGIRDQAKFGLGRQAVTCEYTWPRPFPLTQNLSLKWTHPVVYCPDFQPPWAASWKAFLDAGPQQFQLSILGHRTERCRPKSSSKAPLQVSFQDAVEIQLWVEDLPKYQVTTCMSHTALAAWLDKPWQLRPASTSSGRLLDHCNEARDLFPLLSVPVAGVPQAGRPLLRTMPTWLQHLWRTVFVPQTDAPAYRDEGPEITFISWYLHDPWYPTCHGSRWISFGVEYEQWEERINDCWRDVIDFDQPYDVILVHPEPPRATGEFHQGHLIILQRDFAPQRAAVLVTSHLTDYRTRLQRSAFLAGPLVDRDDVLALVDLRHHCSVLDCTIMAPDEVIGHELCGIRDGDGLIIYGEPSTLRPPEALRVELPEEDSDDDMHLMQSSSFHTPRLNPGSAHYGASHYFRDLDFHPWNDGRHPAWTTEIWEQVYQPQADSWTCRHDPTVELVTWFLNEDTATGCLQYRILHLDHSWWTWEDNVRTLWRDRVHEGLPINVHLVVPEPPRGTLEYHQAHVLVTQLSGQQRGILISAYLETLGRKHLWQRAFSISAAMTREDVLALVSVARRDLYEQYEVFWHESIMDERPQALPHGAGIVVYHGLAAGTPQRQASLQRDGVGDVTVLLAHQALLHQAPAPLMDDPDIAIDPADIEAADMEAEESSSESASGYDVHVDPDSDWTTAILFTLAGEAVVGRIHEVHPELEHREVAHMLEIPPNRLIAIHRVHPAPDDLMDSLQQAYIVQLLHDLPIGTLGQMVLLDVVFCFHLPILDVETIRQVKVMMPMITRTMLFRLLRLGEYCLDEGNPCLLHHNGHLVPSQRDSPLSLRHGDYLKVTVPPPSTSSTADTRIAVLAHYHCLSAAAYPHLERQMPEGFHVDQVPNPTTMLTRLPDARRDTDDEQSLVQTAPPHRQCRIPEDPATLLEPYFVLNEEMARARREAQRLQGLQQLPVGLQDLQQQLLQTDRLDMDDGIQIQTWYLNHRYAWRCNQPRPLVLPPELPDWLPAISQLWRDQLDPTMPLNFHLVHPQPPDMEHDIQAHLIVVQPEEFDLYAVLISLYDNGFHTDQVLRFAVLHGPMMSMQDLLHHADRDQVCLWPDVQCRAWYGWDPLDFGVPFPVHSGDGFTLLVWRYNVPPPDPHAWDDFTMDVNGDDQLNLLQVRSAPTPRVALSLSDLIPESVDLTPTAGPGIFTHPLGSTQLVHLINANLESCLPSFVEVSSAPTIQDIQDELLCWGHEARLHFVSDRSVAICFDPRPATSICLIYVHDTLTDPDGIILHWTLELPGEVDHMKYLYHRGYQRSVILQVEAISPQVYRIDFHNSIPTMDTRDRRQRPPFQWPTPQPQGADKAIFDASLYATSTEAPSSLLTIPQAMDIINDFFTPRAPFLNPELPAIEFPECVAQALAKCGKVDHIDRYLIFTDGSSMSRHKHSPPEWLGEHDYTDAWSFLVLAECYDVSGNPELSTLEFLGWTSQLVVYKETAPHHIGTMATGSVYAEREALFWAGQWRLAVNNCLPTVFLSDSQTGCDQAVGAAGASISDLSYKYLRATFQALSCALPGDHLRVQHIHGHNACAWNEAVDSLAKHECKHQMFVERQSVDMNTWGPVLLHLWMYLGDPRHLGLPTLTSHGFDVGPIGLPVPQSTTAPQSDRPRRNHPCTIQLSMGTYNVRSLYRGPEGHAGKLHYACAQFESHGLNFIGLQETRSAQGVFRHGDTLRLSTGGDNGHLGIEFWVNLTQPYGWRHNRPLRFRAEHFVVTHQDARSLLVRINAPAFQSWVCVAHAPHCGADPSLRQTWWDHLDQLLQHYVQHEHLFLLIDANATSGTSDDIHVFERDGPDNANTEPFRALLTSCGLCLPSTSDLHQGEDETWINPSGTHEQRIDYVAIPTSLLGAAEFSTDLHTLDMDSDHTGVALQLCWTASPVPQHHNGSKRHPAYDRTLISRDGLLHQALSQNLDLSWHTDIETQVATTNAAIHSALSQHCPAPGPKAKKSYMTDALWQLRQDKLCARKALKALRVRTTQHWLGTCFAAWKTGTSTTCPALPAFYNYDVSLRCFSLKYMAKLATVTSRLRRELRSSKMTALAEALANLPPDVSASGILRDLKGFIGPTNPRKCKSKALPLIHKPDGQPCTSPQEIVDCWVDFFKVMEGGFRLSRDDLHASWLRSLQETQISEQTMDLTTFPTLLDLEEAYRRVAPRKAIGDDGIPGEVCRHQPVAIASLAYPSLLKLLCQGQEALLHKGGTLVPVWKQKGPQHKVNSYRSILVSSHLGKGLHRALRQRQQDLYMTYLHHGQLGGRPHVPVGLGLHAARAHLRHLAAQHRSAALLFLDLTEAFYRVIRPLVLSGNLDDATIGAIAQRIGLPSDAIHDFHHHLQDPSAIAQAGLPPHLRRALSMLHDHTHFQVAGQTDCVHTTIGSRPGDCFADVVFGFLFSRILHKLEERMETEDLISRHPAPDPSGLLQRPWQRQKDRWQERHLVCPTWMDDLCIGLDGSTADALAHRTVATASALLDTCAQFMVTPNLQKGKTEVILAFRGPHSRACRLQYYGPQSGGAIPVLYEYGHASLNVVGEYVHLGGLIHHGGVTRKELRRRFGIANAAFNQHRKLLYQNSSLSFEKRKQLFVSLVLSKLCYGMESWVLTDQRSWHFLRAALLRLYRRLLGVSGVAHCTDLEILGRTGLPDEVELLRRSRLRYLTTLYSCESDVHWPLILRDEAWIQLMVQDLDWLGSMVAATCKLGLPAEHPDNWDYVLRYHRGYWKRLVTRAFNLTGAQRGDEFRRYELHRRAFDMLILRGNLALDPPIDPTEPALSFFGCLQCKLSFKTKAGERAHMFKCHQQLNSLRYLFDGTSCAACLKECHAHSKLLAHLRNNPSCRELLLARHHHCDPVPGCGSCLNAAQLDRHNGLLPVQQAQGPRWPAPPARAAPLPHGAFFDALSELCLTISSEEAFLQWLLNVGDSYCLAWTAFVETLQLFAQTLMDDDAATDLPLSVDSLIHIIQEASRPHHWSFLVDSPHHWATNPRSVREYESWAKQLYDLDRRGYANWTSVYCPRVFYRERIILHAFSGRRRRGDLQWYLEGMAEAKPEFLLVVVSLDIVIDPVWGNAVQPDIQAFWLQSILDGYVCGFLGGPPCSTWSRARGQQLKNSDHRAPRVIRDISALWGFLSVSIKEQAQLSDGNDLLGFCILCLVALLTGDGSGLLEHPKPPDEPELASIWRLPLLKFLGTLPEVGTVDLSQGLLGASSAKPTRLLTIRMPTLLSELHKHRVCHVLPKGGNIGLDESGQYRTSPLKEYPPAMCQALANSFLHHTWRVDPPDDADAWASVPSEFLATCRNMHCTDFGQYIGQDCVM